MHAHVGVSVRECKGVGLPNHALCGCSVPYNVCAQREWVKGERERGDRRERELRGGWTCHIPSVLIPVVEGGEERERGHVRGGPR